MRGFLPRAGRNAALARTLALSRSRRRQRRRRQRGRRKVGLIIVVVDNAVPGARRRGNQRLELVGFGGRLMLLPRLLLLPLGQPEQLRLHLKKPNENSSQSL